MDNGQTAGLLDGSAINCGKHTLMDEPSSESAGISMSGSGEPVAEGKSPVFDDSRPYGCAGAAGCGSEPPDGPSASEGKNPRKRGSPPSPGGMSDTNSRSLQCGRDDSPMPKRRRSEVVSEPDTEAGTAPTGGILGSSDHEQGFKRIIAKKGAEGDANTQMSGPPLLHQLRGCGAQRSQEDLQSLRAHIGDMSWKQVESVITKSNVKREQPTLTLAMFFLWRFYHGYDDPEQKGQRNPPHELAEWDRRVILCACVFLAAKIADCPFKLRLCDLAHQLFNERASTRENRRRVAQIAKAEMYLIVSILGFDFTQTSFPHTLIDELVLLTGRTQDELVGIKRGIPWCITAWRFTRHIYRTPLCVKYSARELAAGLVLVTGKPWENSNVWCTMDGTPLPPVPEASHQSWLRSLQKRRNGHAPIDPTRLEDVQRELRAELSLVGRNTDSISQEAAGLHQQVRMRSRSPAPNTPLMRRGTSLSYPTCHPVPNAARGQ